MGRLIDCNDVYNAIQIITDNFGVAKKVVEDNMLTMLSKIETVEAIPKADYETRLKADMVAILVELQLEIDELPNHELQYSDWKQGFTHGLADVQEKVIQKKINELKEKDNGK